MVSKDLSVWSRVLFREEYFSQAGVLRIVTGFVYGPGIAEPGRGGAGQSIVVVPTLV